MRKFKVIRKFFLGFLGKDWKDCYIDFEAVTMKEIKDYFPGFNEMDSKDEKAILKGIEGILEFLGKKFVSGKGIIEDGSLVDLEIGDLENLPAEVLSKALNFLSKGVAPALPAPSKMS